MGTARPLFAKLLLEGIEVPFIGATVTHAVGQASIAYIDLVPHQTIINIKPRTLVHLMVRDFSRPEKNYPWIDMWSGEVFGYAFSKAADSRSFTISCIDNSSYWDNALIYFFNSQQSLGKGAQAISQVGQTITAQQLQAGANGVQAVTSSISSYFLSIISDAQAEGKDFLGALVAIFERLGNINQFYSASEDRLRITDRILLHSSGKLTEILQDQEARDWLLGVAGRESGFSTLRMVVQQLMSLIFHDFVSIPFPARVPTASGLTGDSLPGTGTEDITIGEFLFKPNLYMIAPPVCNIFFPDEYSSFNFNRNFFQEPTRLTYQPEMPASIGSAAVALPQVYQPNSLSYYMYNTGDQDVGTGPLQTDGTFGNFGDTDNGDSAESDQGQQREQQFLTNEEKMRGITMAIEGMVPASSSFRSKISEEGKTQLAERVAQYLFYKKRFQPRTLQVTSHLKMSVVPGFPVLVLDDSDAQQNVIAYCTSVTHRIYSTQGGYTNTTLGYARTVGEQDTISDNTDDPPIPPWFDDVIFGTSEENNTGTFTSYPTQLSAFYQSLLGNKGAQSIPDKFGVETMTDATAALLKAYRAAKKQGFEAVQTLISQITSRDYVSMTDAFGFLGASTNTKGANTSSATFMNFFGTRLSGATPVNPPAGTVGPPAPPVDAAQITARRAVVLAYRKILQTQRGFRG